MVDNATSQGAPGGARAAWLVIGATMIVAIVMGSLLWANYSRFLGYVRATLEDPENPPVWRERALSAEGCVDAALAWAASCRGVKSLCDEYVTRVTQECLQAGGEAHHEAFCVSLGASGTLTDFGYAECRARGVQRHVDAEPCAMAYRAVDAWCHYVRDIHGAPTQLEVVR